MGNELHEPYAAKAAHPVLGRGRGGNTSSLFDYKTPMQIMKEKQISIN